MPTYLRKGLGSLLAAILAIGSPLLSLSADAGRRIRSLPKGASGSQGGLSPRTFQPANELPFSAGIYFPGSTAEIHFSGAETDVVSFGERESFEAHTGASVLSQPAFEEIELAPPDQHQPVGVEAPFLPRPGATNKIEDGEPAFEPAAAGIPSGTLGQLQGVSINRISAATQKEEAPSASKPLSSEAIFQKAAELFTGEFYDHASDLDFVRRRIEKRNAEARAPEGAASRTREPAETRREEAPRAAAEEAEPPEEAATDDPASARRPSREEDASATDEIPALAPAAEKDERIVAEETISAEVPAPPRPASEEPEDLDTAEAARELPPLEAVADGSQDSGIEPPADSLIDNDPDIAVDPSQGHFNLKKGLTLSWATLGGYLVATAAVLHHLLGMTPYSGIQVLAGLGSQFGAIVGAASLIAATSRPADKVRTAGIVFTVSAAVASTFFGFSLEGDLSRLAALAVAFVSLLGIRSFWTLPSTVPKKNQKQAAFSLTHRAILALPIAIVLTALQSPVWSFGASLAYLMLNHSALYDNREAKGERHSDAPASANKIAASPAVENPKEDPAVAQENPFTRTEEDNALAVAEPPVEDVAEEENVEKPTAAAEAPEEAETAPASDAFERSLELLRGKRLHKLVALKGLDRFAGWVDPRDGRVVWIAPKRRGAGPRERAPDARRFHVEVERDPEGKPIALVPRIPSGLEGQAEKTLEEAFAVRSREITGLDWVPNPVQAPPQTQPSLRAARLKPRRSDAPEPYDRRSQEAAVWTLLMRRSLSEQFEARNLFENAENAAVRIDFSRNQRIIKARLAVSPAERSNQAPASIEVAIRYDSVTGKHELHFAHLDLPKHYERYRYGIEEALAYAEADLQESGKVQRRGLLARRSRQAAAIAAAQPVDESDARLRPLEQKVRQAYLRPQQLKTVPRRYRTIDPRLGWRALASSLASGETFSWTIYRRGPRARRIFARRDPSGNIVLEDRLLRSGRRRSVFFTADASGELLSVEYETHEGTRSVPRTRLRVNALTLPPFRGTREGLSARFLHAQARLLRPKIERRLSRRRVRSSALDRIAPAYRDQGPRAGWDALTREIRENRSVQWEVTGPSSRSRRRTLSGGLSRKRLNFRIVDERKAPEGDSTFTFIADPAGELIEAYYTGPEFPRRLRLSANAKTRPIWENIRDALGKKALQQRGRNRN